MARELLLLRHAKSDWGSSAKADFDRPLAKRGLRDAPRVGKWLYREGLVPTLIISSPAKRAMETALHVCKGLDYKKKHIRWEAAIYEAGVEALLEVLASCDNAGQTVLLVGHNPGLEDLLRYLADGDIDDPIDAKLLPTAALARLEMPDEWARLDAGCAGLLSLVRPRKLDT
jgi:phosphohistidine phosphatase